MTRANVAATYAASAIRQAVQDQEEREMAHPHAAAKWTARYEVGATSETNARSHAIRAALDDVPNAGATVVSVEQMAARRWAVLVERDRSAFVDPQREDVVYADDGITPYGTAEEARAGDPEPIIDEPTPAALDEQDVAAVIGEVLEAIDAAAEPPIHDPYAPDGVVIPAAEPKPKPARKRRLVSDGTRKRRDHLMSKPDRIAMADTLLPLWVDALAATFRESDTDEQWAARCHEVAKWLQFLPGERWDDRLPRRGLKAR